MKKNKLPQIVSIIPGTKAKYTIVKGEPVHIKGSRYIERWSVARKANTSAVTGIPMEEK